MRSLGIKAEMAAVDSYFALVTDRQHYKPGTEQDTRSFCPAPVTSKADLQLWVSLNLSASVVKSVYIGELFCTRKDKRI